MKIVLIDGSPKKRFSASRYFLLLQRIFVRGHVVTLKLRTRRDHRNILDELADADAVVFSIPLYVDCVPSHILPFLREMELFAKEHQPDLKVYAIANNGFIEGNQNAPLFRVMDNFCRRANLSWCGGIGIGGGVMFQALRVVWMVEAGIFLLSLFISGFVHGNWIPTDAIWQLLYSSLLIAFFHLGALFAMVRMGRKINRRERFGGTYTRILLPSFLFILISDVFFVIVSLLKGGLFRGWLKRK